MQDVRTLGSHGRRGARGPGDPHCRRAQRRRTAGRETAVALVSMAPALLALRSGDLAAYHGVEHKAIAGYEEGADAADAARSTTAAARTWSRRCSPRRPSGTSRCAARACADPPPRRPWGSAAPRWPWRCSPGASAIPDAAVARAAPPAGLRDPARRGHARADRGAARGRQGGARGDPARRGRPVALVAHPPARASTRRCSGCPSSGSARATTPDAYFNFTSELLVESGAGTAGDGAGVPEAALGARRHRRGDRGAEALRPDGAGAGWETRGPRPPRGRRDRAVGAGPADRGRLLAVRPPRDRLPRLLVAPHADHAQRARGGGGRATASRSCSSRRATTTGSCRRATAGPRTWPARSASRPTRRRPGGAARASGPCRTR